MNIITFKSNQLKVIPFEDDELNPGILGKSVGEWIRTTLRDTPYPVSEFIAEDFGYCLMIKRKPYWLWVGVSGHSDYQFPENGLTEEIARAFPIETITWQVWVTTEWGILSRLLGNDKRKKEASTLFSIITTQLQQQGMVAEVLKRHR